MNATDTVTVEPYYVDTTDPGALVTWYPHELAPQPVRLCLDLESGRFEFETDPEVGNAVPMRHYHGIVQTWATTTLDPISANALLDELTPAAQRILDDSEIVWDGSNHVARLGSDADLARDEIAEAVDPHELNPADTIDTAAAADAFGEVRDETLAAIGLAAETPDEALPAMCQQLEAEALDNGTVVVHVERWLEDQRDELREQLDEELGEAADQIKAATERRDALIRRASAYRPLRYLAATCEISHQSVANIVNRG